MDYPKRPIKVNVEAPTQIEEDGIHRAVNRRKITGTGNIVLPIKDIVQPIVSRLNGKSQGG